MPDPDIHDLRRRANRSKPARRENSWQARIEKTLQPLEKPAPAHAGQVLVSILIWILIAVAVVIVGRILINLIGMLADSFLGVIFLCAAVYSIAVFLLEVALDS